jgi:4-hydroxybenzoate polyprenyltransferase
VKRRRPIASGVVPVQVAFAFAVILLAGSWLGSIRLDPYFTVTLIGYFLLTTAYTLKLKHIVIVDLLVLAAGFVLRAVAGAIAINVEISPWLLLCTTLLALFIGLAKRRHELVMLEEGAGKHRKILDEYSVAFLDQMINITSATALMAYSLYTFSGISRTGSKHPYMMITIPFVIYGVFRYLYLIHKKNAGGRPEQVLLDDTPLLVNVGLWAITVVIVLRWSDVAEIIKRFI